MIEKLRLSDDDREQIRIILESQVDVGAKYHGVIANTLFRAYAQTEDPAEKLLFGLEIFSKLMHIVEDVGLHCLTWLESEKSGDPIGEFTSKQTRHIFNFYKRCAEGLSDNDIATIHCIWTPEHMLEAGKINSEQLRDYTRCFGLTCETLRLIFKGFAATYVEKPDGQIGNLKYGDVVNMYFNIKHGVKIIWPNRPLGIAFYRKYKIPPTTLPVLVGPRETPEGSSAIRGLHFAHLDFSEQSVRKMMENCFHASHALTKMAESRMEWLESPDEPPMRSPQYASLYEGFCETLSRARIPEFEKKRLLEEWRPD